MLNTIKKINAIKNIQKSFGYKAFDNTRIIIDPKLMNPNYKEFKFIDYDEIGKVIKIKPGFWRLENDLIIPENFF